jgi:hypothetical protein
VRQGKEKQMSPARSGESEAAGQAQVSVSSRVFERGN